MRWRIFIISMILLYSALILPIPSSGTETTDNEITWSGHIVLNSTFAVNYSQKLIILPGTTVEFTSPGAIMVHGTLEARDVIFTAENGWGGIVGDGTIDIDGFTIRNAMDGIRISGGNGKIKNGMILNSSRDGVRVDEYGHLGITNVTIDGANLGIDCVSHSNATITQVEITNYVVAISVQYSRARIEGARINSGSTRVVTSTGIYARDAIVNIDRSTIENNLVGVDASASDMRIYSTIFSNNMRGIISDTPLNLTEVSWVNTQKIDFNYMVKNYVSLQIRYTGNVSASAIIKAIYPNGTMCFNGSTDLLGWVKFRVVGIFWNDTVNYTAFPMQIIVIHDGLTETFSISDFGRHEIIVSHPESSEGTTSSNNNSTENTLDFSDYMILMIVGLIFLLIIGLLLWREE